jgi:hypothetical protein
MEHHGAEGVGRASDSILGPGWLAGTAATTAAAVARTGGWEMHRGLVWPRMSTGAAFQRA